MLSNLKYDVSLPWKFVQVIKLLQNLIRPQNNI